MKGVVTVVLAAGKGARHGGPKALLEWPGRGGVVPLAIAHADARLAAESERVLVVVRNQVMPALLGYVTIGVDLVVSNAAEELGAAGSLAVAVGKLEASEKIVVATPVDVPPARDDTLARLLERLVDGIHAVRPRHGTRAGHPVVIRAEALDAYRGAAPPVLREHLRALGARCVDVDVDDPSVLVNLNTPADVAAFRGTAFRGG